MTTTTTRRFEAPGRPAIAYEDLGDADALPVVLLHGAGSARGDWVRTGIAPKLATEHRVLVLDQRGHGESGWAPGEYTIPHFTADAEAFVEDVIGGPASFVGHSLGGMVSAQLAGTRPDLVRRAFLEDPPVWFDRPTWARWRASAAAAPWQLQQQLIRGFQEDGATVAQVVDGLRPMPAPFGDGTIGELFGKERLRFLAESWLRFDPEVLTPLLDGSFFDGFDRTRPITCPVRLLRADPALASFRPEDEAPFLATHPQATVARVEGASHLIHMEHPERFLTEVQAFLADE